MPAQVIVLNGGSSAGKSEIVRCLQAVLPDPWLATGVVHLGVTYDLEVDTSFVEPLASARIVAARIAA